MLKQPYFCYEVKILHYSLLLIKVKEFHGNISPADSMLQWIEKETGRRQPQKTEQFPTNSSFSRQHVVIGQFKHVTITPL